MKKWPSESLRIWKHCIYTISRKFYWDNEIILNLYFGTKFIALTARDGQPSVQIKFARASIRS